MWIQVASIFADTSWYFAESSAYLDTERGWSWFSQNRLFQAISSRPFCHLVRTAFISRRSIFLSVHLLSASASTSICSNWNTIFSSFSSLLAYFLASSRVTPEHSPTVMVSALFNTFSRISCRYSWTWGPFAGSLKLAYPLIPGFPSGRSGFLEIRLITSIRNPSTPFFSHQFIMSNTSSRTFGLSQFRSGCFFENRCR